MSRFIEMNVCTPWGDYFDPVTYSHNILIRAGSRNDAYTPKQAHGSEAE